MAAIPTAPTAERARPIFIASTAAYCIANVGWWLQPQMLSEIMPRFHLTAADASWILAAELVAISLSTLAAARFAARMAFSRLLLVGLLVLLVGQGWSIGASSPISLLLARLLDGVGEGLVLMVSSAALADFADADRAYGQINAINVAVGSGVNFALPALATFFGSAIVFPTNLIASVLLAPLLWRMPRGVSVLSSGSSHARAAPPLRWGAPPLLALMLATLLLGTGSGAVWAFLIEIGHRTSLNDAQLDQAVAIATACALLGSALAAWLSTRVGRLAPVAVGLVVLAGANFLITHTTHASVYRLTACLNLGCIYLLLPYLFGYGAAMDRSGRAAAAVGGAFLFTGASGPVLGGALVEAAGVGALGSAVVLVALVTLALILYVESALRARQSRQPLNQATSGAAG